MIVDFLVNNWFLVGVVFFLVLLVLWFVKKVIKWVLTLVLVLALVLYGLNYAPKEVQDLGNTFIDNVVDNVKESAIKTLVSELPNAEYDFNEDGNYTITVKDIKLTGVLGEPTATVSVLEQRFEIKLNDNIISYIEKAQKE